MRCNSCNSALLHSLASEPEREAGTGNFSVSRLVQAQGCVIWGGGFRISALTVAYKST